MGPGLGQPRDDPEPVVDALRLSKDLLVGEQLMRDAGEAGRLHLNHELKVRPGVSTLLNVLAALYLAPHEGSVAESQHSVDDGPKAFPAQRGDLLPWLV